MIMKPRKPGTKSGDERRFSYIREPLSDPKLCCGKAKRKLRDSPVYLREIPGKYVRFSVYKKTSSKEEDILRSEHTSSLRKNLQELAPLHIGSALKDMMVAGRHRACSLSRSR